MTRLAPGVRVYMSGYKSAHVIRSVDRHLAYPWCADVDEIALLAVADGRPESPKLARADRPTCMSCREVMDSAAAHPTPGQLLRQKRTDRGWTQVVLAEALGRPTQLVSEVECGRKAVTAATALLLEAAFGVPALEWLRLQNLVDLERARRCA